MHGQDHVFPEVGGEDFGIVRLAVRKQERGQVCLAAVRLEFPAWLAGLEVDGEQLAIKDAEVGHVTGDGGRGEDEQPGGKREALLTRRGIDGVKERAVGGGEVGDPVANCRRHNHPRTLGGKIPLLLPGLGVHGI